MTTQFPAATWSTFEHGPIETLADNLWRVVGSIAKMSIKRQMIVARRTDGRLVVHNAIRQSAVQQAELEAKGEIGALVVPNGFHRLDSPAYKSRYPNARVYAPKGARKRVEEKLPVDGSYADFPADGAVLLEPLDGVNDAEGAMIVTSSDGVTVVLNDIVMNMDRKTDWSGFLFNAIMASAPGPRVARHIKLVMVKDKKALRANLERLAALPRLTRFIVAHEKVAHGSDAAAALRQACTYL